MTICKMAVFLNSDPFSETDVRRFYTTLAEVRSAIRTVAFDWASKILSNETVNFTIVNNSDGIVNILSAIEIETDPILSSIYIYGSSEARFVSNETNLDEIQTIEVPVTFSEFYKSLASQRARTFVRNVFIHYAHGQLAGARRRIVRREQADLFREEGDEDLE